MLLTNCNLDGNPRLQSLRIVGELVSEIAPNLARVVGEEVIDAGGLLLTSSLTEPHAHLDKAFLAERIDNPTGDLMGAINAMESSRDLITVADTVERAERAVRLMVSNGVTAIRTHADVTEWNKLDSVEALVEVRNRTKEIVNLQICALLGWPLSGDVGKSNRELGRRAIEMGADILGGCPHLDIDPEGANIALIELAGELNCGLDLHTDEHTDANRISLEHLASRITASGFNRPVVASHCVSLGMQDESTQRRIAEKVATANMGVVALPHTNLFLQGREFATATPRGLTAVASLRRAGVKVAVGADNLQDPFNPIGRGDPLESAALAILTAHLLPHEAFDSVSKQARAVIGLASSGPKVGDVADLMLIPAGSIREAIANTPPRKLVFYKGRIVSSRLATSD
ncbi:MAG: hydrolase [Actinobacteria bacterium]|nr:hydrolase [Actinomycetota bacterium]NDA96868.1 hydrolase [Actinomycetota bacterium]NDC99952.1 hydrolase [bacterium]NDF66533.1 hydrolase [Actinomycetota bacterium]